MQHTNAAAKQLLECIAKLNAAGIGLNGAFIAQRLEDDHFMVTGDQDLTTIDENNLLIMDQRRLKQHHAMIHGIFTQNPSIAAVIRTHPQYCCQAAARGEIIPPVLDDMAQIVGGYARVCDMKDLSKLISTVARHYACLTGGDDSTQHGAIAAGRSLNHAYTATLVLEKSAQVYLQGMLLGGAKYLNPIEARLMHQIYKQMYSRKAQAARHQTAADNTRTIGQAEMQLRREVVELGKQLSCENLVQGTWGNISARLDKQYMLCTPSGLDYFTITPYDIVRVDLHTLKHEGNLKPTAEKTLHAALMVAHKDVNCVIHTHPVHSSVFAAAHKKIQPESAEHRALLGGDVQVAKYAFPSTNALCKHVVAAMRHNHACVMENHGMVVKGTSLQDAHVKCSVTEQCAQQTLYKLGEREHTNKGAALQ